MVETLNKAQHLLYCHHLLPSLENIIVDQQHHLIPNLMSTAGLKLLLWNRPILAAEFREVVPLLPSNTFTLPPDQRTTQHMLRQKAIANVFLSLLINNPVTYSGELNDLVTPDKA